MAISTENSAKLLKKNQRLRKSKEKKNKKYYPLSEEDLSDLKKSR